MPVRRKGEGRETNLSRDHGKQSTTMRKRTRSSKVSLVSRVSGELDNYYLLPSGIPIALSSPFSHASRWRRRNE